MKYSNKVCIAPPARVTREFLNKLAAALFLLCFTEASPAADLSFHARHYSGRVAYAACNDFVLSCEDGHHYPFCRRAVSPFGDVVTGTLVVGHHGIRMRMIPMGAGYRYAGPGVWFEGVESEAMLNFGKRYSVACTVAGAAPHANRFSHLY
jgi:hypothetical protein